MPIIEDTSDKVPQSLTAGDTRTWSILNSNFPASTHTMIYYLHGREATLKITGVANGDTHDFTLDANKTENWVEQSAYYGLVATISSLRYTVEHGSITMFANPAKSDAGKRIRDIEQDIAAIEAFKSGRAKKGVIRSSGFGRSLDKMPLEEILMLETNLRIHLITLKHSFDDVRSVIRIGI
ncbi:hypothetical protein LCGC14_1033040 [marine sediment metagenome]|uniref:Uncharacterized protein n=1 Tax=marine sediment metagenome TaxID=412755 RepID=A0A0F9QC72_9ZZZZ